MSLHTPILPGVRSPDHTQLSFYALLSADGVVLEADDAFLAAVGVARAEVIEREFAAAHWFAGHETVRAQATAALRRAQGGETVRCELRAPVTAGPPVVMATTLIPLNEAGRLTRIAIIGQHSTLPPSGEIAPALDAARLQEAERIALLGHWDHGFQDGRIVWSEEVFRIFGFEPGEIEPNLEAFYELVHPADRTRVHAAVDATLTQYVPFDLIHRIVRRDGTERVLHERATVSRTPAGDPVRMFGTVQDITEREQLHAALTQAAAALSATLDSTTDGIMAIDRGCRLLHHNHRLLEMWGFGLPAADPADGRALREQMFARMKDSSAARTRTAAIDADPNFVSHDRFELKDGRIFERLTRPQLNGTQVTGRVCSFRDVTGQVRSVAALKASEARLAGILTLAEEAIITIDGTGRMVLFNRGAERTFGYSAGEAIGQPLALLLPAQHAAAHAAHVAAFGAGTDVSRAMSGRRPIEGRRKDGSLFPAEASISRLHLPEGVFFTAILRDITERRRIEAARDHSLSRMQATLESTADGILVIDLEGRIMAHNRLAVQLWRLAEIVPFPATMFDAWQLVSHEVIDPDGVIAGVRRLMSEPMVERQDEIRFKDGRVYERYSRPQLLDGRPVGRVVSFRDVTAARRAKEAHARLEAQLRQAQKLEAVGTLAGGIAHDFNNILTGILGYAQLAEAAEPDGPTAKECAREIAIAARRASDLVRQLLTFSRLQPQDRAIVSLVAVVRDTVRLLRPVVPASIELRLVLPPDSPAVLANATQVQQVLLNLCTNARQAIGGRQGFIAIKVESREIDFDFAHAHPGLRAGRYAVLSVVDNGPGMTTAVVERIFEPFFTTKAPGDGSGLGLAAVHGIMRSHEGSVTVESAPGAGATFQLYFPALETLAPPAAAAASDVRRGQGEHILLVDDEEALTALGQQLLSHLGYRVTALSDPVVALSLFLESPGEFDAAVLDISMPALTGLELAAHLREVRPELPVVLVTGHPGATPQAELDRLGVAAVLEKPGTVDSVGVCLGQIFSGK
ncbi:MAG: PAS domain S-box protein [Verrucomicrobia bacterium]|nr:PAS domain S-box protein [Verrucomicrobiota bacterium]